MGGYGSPHGDLPIYVKTVFGKVKTARLLHFIFTQLTKLCVIKPFLACVCVCVCLGGSSRGWPSEERRPDHGRQRADFGRRHTRRSCRHPEEDQRNCHAHCAVIDTHMQTPTNTHCLHCFSYCFVAPEVIHIYTG